MWEKLLFWFFCAFFFAVAASCRGYSAPLTPLIPPGELSSQPAAQSRQPEIPWLGSSAESSPPSATDSPATPHGNGRPMELEKSNVIFWIVGGVLGGFMALFTVILFLAEKREDRKWAKTNSSR